jgi:hypothetical protein
MKMENRFKVQRPIYRNGYVIYCTVTGKESAYTIGNWHDACNQCTNMNGALPETQDREVSEFFA